MSGDKDRISDGAGNADPSGLQARLRSSAGLTPLEKIDAAGEAGSVECGALVRIELYLGDGIIREARQKSYGCPATIASAHEVASRVKSMPFLEAAAVSEEEISQALDLSPEFGTSVELALEALHNALGGAASVSDELRPDTAASQPVGEGVLVGMSGGVDSAVAAMLLKRQGFHVVGVTLKLWSDPGSADERSCCSPEAVRRARRTAHGLGIPHLTIDASGPFLREVVGYFVEEYARGRTPNPCAKCNARLRFGLMLEIGDRLGLRRVATGHYARMGGSPFGLMRGVDRSKDQSYVLAEVPPGLLQRVVFPLGHMTKPEVRALATEAGLEAQSVPESQEICFVADDDHKRFLRDRLGESPGMIIDRDGREIGHHRGTYNFTIGQRRGLGIASPTPLYVVGLDAERALVLAGSAEDCRVGEVVLEDLVQHRPGLDGLGAIQVRSSGPAVPGQLRTETGSVTGAADDGLVSVLLDEPIIGVAPGQTAVVYDQESVVLAGTIRSTGRWSEGAYFR